MLNKEEYTSSASLPSVAPKRLCWISDPVWSLLRVLNVILLSQLCILDSNYMSSPWAQIRSEWQGEKLEKELDLHYEFMPDSMLGFRKMMAGTSLEIQYFHSTTWHQVSLLYFQYHATSFLPHMMLLWACTTLFFAKGYQGISTQNSEVSVWEASSSWVLYLAKFSHFICPGILIFTSWAQRVHHSLLGLELILPVQNRT